MNSLDKNSTFNLEISSTFDHIFEFFAEINLFSLFILFLPRVIVMIDKFLRHNEMQRCEM